MSAVLGWQRLKYRNRLPQLDGGVFLGEGTTALRRYFERYASLAWERGLGFVLESPTWPANWRPPR